MTICPVHQVEFILIKVEQGDRVLGFFKGCPNEDCDECEDLDPKDEAEMMGSFTPIPAQPSLFDL
jgi:hypothetical protein